MRYAIIMAGGSGKRLWPASRQSKPKQLINLVDGKSLLALAVERLDGIFDSQRILVITNAAYVDEIRECFPQLLKENVIGEPEGRDTANAIALGAELIAARDPDATMAVFTADHIIRPKDQFTQCVESACKAAEDDPRALVTFGIRPTYPHTGLGYVHCGGEGPGGTRAVLGFKEKPDHHTARWYVESGEHFWNSGMFVWRVQAIREDYDGLLEKVYPQLPKISIDYAVMEKAEHVLMVELTCEWLDVGSWPALDEVVQLDVAGNAVLAARAAVLDSNRNVIFSAGEHLVAVVGMDDCVIVHSPDATLVCKKNDSQRLKELVDWIGQHFGSQYV